MSSTFGLFVKDLSFQSYIRCSFLVWLAFAEIIELRAQSLGQGASLAGIWWGAPAFAEIMEFSLWEGNLSGYNRMQDIMDAEREFKSKATQMLTTVIVGTEVSKSPLWQFNPCVKSASFNSSIFLVHLCIALIEITSFNISFLNSPFVTLSES